MGKRTRIKPYIHLPSATTMGEARQIFRDGLGGSNAVASHGIRCPMCRQLAKIYKRKLNSSMAHALVLIYRHFSIKDPDVAGWVHVPKLLNGFGTVSRGGDWAKLAHWRLLEECPNERKDGSKRAGEWRITKRGQEFARSQVTVPTFCWFYNQDAIALSVERTDIKSALGQDFHYDELMAS